MYLIIDIVTCQSINNGKKKLLKTTFFSVKDLCVFSKGITVFLRSALEHNVNSALYKYVLLLLLLLIFHTNRFLNNNFKSDVMIYSQSTSHIEM